MGNQVRAGIFMSFFAFLVLGVTVFIFKTTGQFRKDTQKALQRISLVLDVSKSVRMMKKRQWTL